MYHSVSAFSPKNGFPETGRGIMVKAQQTTADGTRNSNVSWLPPSKLYTSDDDEVSKLHALREDDACLRQDTGALPYFTLTTLLNGVSLPTVDLRPTRHAIRARTNVVRIASMFRTTSTHPDLARTNNYIPWAKAIGPSVTQDDNDKKPDTRSSRRVYAATKYRRNTEDMLGPRASSERECQSQSADSSAEDRRRDGYSKLGRSRPRRMPGARPIRPALRDTHPTNASRCTSSSTPTRITGKSSPTLKPSAARTHSPRRKPHLYSLDKFKQNESRNPPGSAQSPGTSQRMPMEAAKSLLWRKQARDQHMSHWRCCHWLRSRRRQE
ncbi:hypothetical protein CC86DRAFT_388626 [Ophiobolus disseminans]|uniref:Uncharacterized protein n=1 Tax=Ophiobolus disseminans TaxID=1469910 RepID=A0A6A6ZDJ4_9PLEO|nr:hypothetical protein CC86DRAFT_388626 [Ophiobolus disseminans]